MAPPVGDPHPACEHVRLDPTSIALWLAVVVSQAAGFRGTPSADTAEAAYLTRRREQLR